MSLGISRISANRLALAIMTSSAPATRCFQVPLPCLSRSTASDTRLIVDTRRPRPVSSTTRRRTSSDFSRHSPIKLKAFIARPFCSITTAIRQPWQAPRLHPPSLHAISTKSATAPTSDNGRNGTGASTGSFAVTASTNGSSSAISRRFRAGSTNSSFGYRSAGNLPETRCQREPAAPAGPPRRVHQHPWASPAATPCDWCWPGSLPGLRPRDASRCRFRAFRDRPTSGTRLTVDTRRPRPVSSATSRRTISVLPAQPPTTLNTLINISFCGPQTPGCFDTLGVSSRCQWHCRAPASRRTGSWMYPAASASATAVRHSSTLASRSALAPR